MCGIAKTVGIENVGEPIVIIGAGGHAREIADVIEAINSAGRQWSLLGFVAEEPPQDELAQRRGLAFLGGLDALDGKDAHFVVGIGSPDARRRMDVTATSRGLVAATLIHPSATVGSDNRLEPGVVLAAHSSVTTNVGLGRHTHLNVGARVAHDCRIGDFVTVNPGATISGNVTLAHDVTVGTNATVIQGVTVGADAIVGAGAAVVRDVAADATVVGVPARPLSGTT